ncbi:von Willebrand factor A domain-containing protein 8 [Daktulosphaira vitifoliae]|uniref:von Willebrand factor A domain-containing protein 8 n=1 Tax=Daktulosphaira vitifoliae TaxID=58002 RepID=UPI0021AA789D|nr:von Willebrand factor A domain-containing protein 8 [Daktulosphaira vitifoliae]XP_050525859.1 von Willebrand factor A domain-containing protein 8 [Daktulosphaira vitifoliae]
MRLSNAWKSNVSFNLFFSLKLVPNCRAIMTFERKRYGHSISNEENSTFKITIGDVKKLTKSSKTPEFVPTQYLSMSCNQEAISHLRWMLQKDILGQDMFLIGTPGSQRRRLAMAYLELTNKSVEFVSLSQDTTEADLKQRREIVSGTAKYFNQSAVKAAIEGRVLVLDGIEKAERNVLPILNNLLENREIHLEDGRFLLAPKTYDNLLKEHGLENMIKWNLVRVSEDFLVIALGLPVPTFSGIPLDPPLRSRFQARNITTPSYLTMLNDLMTDYSTISKDKLEQLLSCAYALASPESTELGLHYFPIENLPIAAKLIHNNSSVSTNYLLKRLYPYDSFMNVDGKNAVNNIVSSFCEEEDEAIKCYVSSVGQPENSLIKIVLSNSKSFTVPCGEFSSNPIIQDHVKTNYQDKILADLALSHSASDICIIGPRGCGKTAIVNQFAAMFNYDIETISLYQDLTSRDLIQHRSTLPNGDTIWKYSPLVVAALEGKLTVLDGLHRLHSSTLTILHRLIQDRDLQLHDGTRLLRSDRYDNLASKLGTSTLEKANILRIHPAFRIIALAESPGGTIPQWITPEVLNLFLFHEIRPLSAIEELSVIQNLYPNSVKSMKSLVSVAENLRKSSDAYLNSLAFSLSTRQLLRIAKRLEKYSDSDFFSIVNKACLSQFLPLLTKQMLENTLRKCNIRPITSKENNSVIECKYNNEYVTIGQTTVSRYSTNATTKVPNILFYDLPQHLKQLELMLQDFMLGEHLLLVGNQGVGKNKIVDRFLQLMNRPREYIQLHRDTTVQSLTSQQTVIDGLLKIEDSPLVKAVKAGYVLVVDEADKAPIHVTCVLKNLVETGNMRLADGRLIVNNKNSSSLNNSIISLHPDFRMIILANRPGFPFLGNNLFSTLGDVFSCHIINNPSQESETLLLKSYGPNVSEEIIEQIILAFGDLRQLFDKNLVSYPYSTREAVNIIKHLQNYPQDSLSDAIRNVFDFDSYSKEAQEVITNVLSQHKMPIKLSPWSRSTKKDNLQITIEKESGLDVSSPKHGKVDEKNEPHVGGNTWAGGTGGRDTAGLGGKGGPYRLDAKHKVFQVSDEEKNAVPEHVKKAAREMGQKAYKERLKQIEMSEYDDKVYNEYSQPVQKQVQALRVILNSLQAKSKERQWVKHQTSGELDDTKLIEGVIGEKSIYRKRSNIDPQIGAPQLKPKRLRFIVDVSGSMYRFNSYDGRLDRELEAVVLVMEALSGFEDKIIYDIVGHSGETECLKFVDKFNPPTDNKKRLEVIKKMHAHTQFCMAGDNTLQSVVYAQKTLEAENKDFDEAVIILLSDANLARYNIRPEKLAAALTLSSDVQSYAIFIGSLGDQADMLNRSLPTGKSFVCMDLKHIPQIIQQIFMSSIINVF